MSKRFVSLLLFLLCSVFTYELPTLLTLAKTGWQPLPPVLVADQMLYLNVSAIHHVSATEVLNPWYGTRVLATDVPHLLFPLTFRLFHFVHLIFASWTAAMLAWTAVFSALSFTAAVFCLRSFFPDLDPFWVNAGSFGLLVLQTPVLYIGGVRQLFSSHGLLPVQLPYLRFAIPQVILPVVFFYWALQVRALRGGHWVALAGMAILQFAEFAAFPYVLPVLALGTGAAFVIAKLRYEKTSLPWTNMAAFGACCGLLDFSYLLLVGFGKSHANVHFALQFRPEALVHQIRPYMVLLVTASVLALFTRLSSATIATAAGLGLANALFGFADAFLDPASQMLQHPNYIVGITTWLPLYILMWAFWQRSERRWLRPLSAGALISLGLLQAVSSAQMMLSQNLLQAAATAEMRQLRVGADDLVIASSRFSDDISSWVPLISSARVLYTPDGENILSMADTQSAQTLRQAIYLKLTGMNDASLNLATEPGSSDVQLAPLLQQTDRTYSGSRLERDRLLVRRTLRERLTPVFSQLDADPSKADSLFAGYKRVLLIDSVAKPSFDDGVISEWFSVEQFYQSTGLRIQLCHYRAKASRTTIIR